jgi:phosphonate transport system substrate-binding protein
MGGAFYSKDNVYPNVKLGGALVTGVSPERASSAPPLRIVLASITSPQEARVYYSDLINYIGGKLEMPVEVIQCKTYGEANDLVRAGNADVAFVCTYAYVLGHDEFGMNLLGIPEIQGRRNYQAYIVVRKDSGIKRFDELRGKTFAFTDPISTTGTLYPLYLVKALGGTPESFFGRYFYTYSHDYALRSVADNLADGASIDSTVWDYLIATNPGLVANLQIIERSPAYGMPPVTMRPSLSKTTQDKLRQIFFNMNGEPDGQKILAKLHIDRFVAADDAMYNQVRELAAMVKRHD